VHTCLLNPPKEINLASKLLDAAADALLARRFSLARDLIVGADLPEIRAYAIRVVGKMSTEVHRITRLPKSLPKDQRDPRRMPAGHAEYAIYERDSWHCRFCGSRVIDRKARNVFAKQFGIESRWTSKEFQRHATLHAMAASLDHVVPHARGGTNETDNLITACYCCQFGRGNLTLEEAELSEPHERPPISDPSWDGLSRISRVRPIDS
jgi:5-methylcytosine-specific restriction endonuclease McrA